MQKRWFPVCRGCIWQLLASPRCWAVLIITVLYADRQMAPIRADMARMQLGISLPGILACLLNDTEVSAMTALGCLALMFDLPATDELQRYLMLRTGRTSWAKGQAAYCMSIAVGYAFFFLLCCCLLLVPCLDLTVSWGAGVEAMMTHETESLLVFDVWIPRVYSALSAFGLEIVLHILLFGMLGMLLSNVNMLVDRRIGFFTLAAPIGLDMLLQEYFSEKVYYFSPVTLSRLSGLDYGDEMGRPPVWFAIFGLLIMIVVLNGLFVYSVKRREVRF